jgi:hypothetical protein
MIARNDGNERVNNENTFLFLVPQKSVLCEETAQVVLRGEDLLLSDIKMRGQRPNFQS